VTVDVVGVVPPPRPPPPPLHALMKLMPAARTTKARSEITPRRFLKTSSSAASVSVETGKNFLIRGDNSADALAVIVSVSVTALLEGESVVGAKEQLAPPGRREQAKLTAALKPYWGVTVRVIVPELPD
jgi:hypothetical protein